MAPQQTNSSGADVKFAVDVSRGFTSWLEDQGASLTVTTYQVGKIIMLGVREDKRLWVHNRNIGRCLGLAVCDDGFWTTSDTQLYSFRNVLQRGETGPDGTDALYAPRLSFFTGDLDIHDIGIDKQSRPIFVNTLFNCLARPSSTHSFEPVWTPPFITKLASEDRCHLNGLAMREGEPAFVTAVSQSNVFNGWRDHRRDGGIVIDVASGEIICSGLSMPHSPRWHKGKLWLHNSGRGEFGYVDMDAGRFEPVAFCPGYLRGLGFLGNMAVVGLSLPRDNKTFSGLDLDDRLAAEGISPKCGLYFIDLQTGSIAHSVIFSGVVTELYDVAALPNTIKPAAIGPMSKDLGRILSVSPASLGRA